MFSLINSFKSSFVSCCKATLSFIVQYQQLNPLKAKKRSIETTDTTKYIIKGVSKEKHEIISGGTEKWGILVNRLFPKLFYRILRKKSGE